MATPADAIAYLAHAGLNQAQVMQAAYYLQTGQVPEGIDQKAWDTIQYLGNAGLDAAGVARANNYLSTGRDPEGEAQAAQPAAPQASLAVDPAWLAFRRSLGVEDAADAATTQQQIDALNRRAGLQRGDLIEQGVQQRQGIADSHEARGLFRSGGRLKSQAQQQSGEGKALGQIEAGLAEGVSGLAQSLAQRRAERERRGAEQGLSTAATNATRGY